MINLSFKSLCGKQKNEASWTSPLKPTCFTNIGKPSLIDVILTNKPEESLKTCNFSTGVSDVHNLIGIQLKSKVMEKEVKWKKCRSFKNFDHDKLVQFSRAEFY